MNSTYKQNENGTCGLNKSTHGITNNFCTTLQYFSIDKEDNLAKSAIQLIKCMESNIDNLYKSTGTVWGVFFADHSKRHAERLSNFCEAYFKELHLSSTDTFQNTLQEKERLPFLVILFSSIMLHDISMGYIPVELKSADITVLEAVVNQKIRVDHVNSSLYRIVAAYFDTDIPALIPQDKWRTFWSNASLNSTHDDMDILALQGLLRICKSHGDPDKIWMDVEKLKILQLAKNEVQGTSASIGETSTTLKTTFGQLGPSILLQQGITIDDSLCDIVKSASAFLNLADLYDVGGRIDYLSPTNTIRMKDIFIKSWGEKQARKKFFQHLISDALVDTPIPSYNSTKSAMEIFINIQHLPPPVDWTFLYLSSHGATKTLLEYAKNVNLTRLLSNWKYTSASLKFQFSSNRNKVDTISAYYYDLLTECINGNNEEKRPYRTTLKEIFHLLYNGGTIPTAVAVSNNSEVKRQFLNYRMMGYDTSLHGISLANNGSIEAGAVMIALEKGVPLDALIQLQDKNTFQHIDIEAPYDDKITVIVSNNEDESLDFLAAIRISKLIASSYSQKNNFSSVSIKWAERRIENDDSPWAELNSTQIRCSDIYIIPCKDQETVSRIPTMIAKNSDARFVIIQKPQDNLKIHGDHKLLVAEYVYKSKDCSFRRTNLFDKLINLGEYLYSDMDNPTSNSKNKNELKQEINLGSLMGKLYIEFGGTQSLVNHLKSALNPPGIQSVLLYILFSMTGEIETNKESSRRKKINEKTLQKYFVNACIYAFPDKAETQHLQEFTEFLGKNFSLYREDISDGRSTVSNIVSNIDTDMVIAQLEESLAKENNARGEVLYHLLQAVAWFAIDDLGKVNIVSKAFSDLIFSLSTDRVVEFITDPNNELIKKNALTITCMLAVKYSESRSEFIADRYRRHQAFLTELIGKLLSKCSAPPKPFKEYDFIVNQALYRMISIFIEVSTLNSATSLFHNFHQKFCDNPLYRLAEIEAICSNSKIGSFWSDDADQNYLREDISHIVIEFKNTWIHHFAFDILFEYGCKQNAIWRKDIEEKLFEEYASILTENDSVTESLFLLACEKSRVIEILKKRKQESLTEEQLKIIQKSEQTILTKEQSEFVNQWVEMHELLYVNSPAALPPGIPPRMQLKLMTEQEEEA